MRTLLALILLTFVGTSTGHAATQIGPLIAPGEITQPARERFIDRSSARTLLRMTAPVVTRRLVPNLKHEAAVTTLVQPLRFGEVELARIVIAGATSLRLHVTGVAPGTVLLVAGEEDESFERFEPSGLATWTPTTRGSTVYIAVESGSATA